MSISVVKTSVNTSHSLAVKIALGWRRLLFWEKPRMAGPQPSSPCGLQPSCRALLCLFCLLWRGSETQGSEAGGVRARVFLRHSTVCRWPWPGRRPAAGRGPVTSRPAATCWEQPQARLQPGWPAVCGQCVRAGPVGMPFHANTGQPGCLGLPRWVQWYPCVLACRPGGLTEAPPHPGPSFGVCRCCEISLWACDGV